MFIWFSELDRWIPLRRSFDASNLPKGWQTVRIGDVVSQVTARELAQPDKEYRMAGVKWYAEGVFHRETVLGKEMSAKFVTPLVPGALIYNRLFAWKESFAVVGPEHAVLCVSSEFPQFLPDTARLMPEFIYLFCTRPKTIEMVNAASAGSAAVSRNRFKEEEFLKLEMPLPPLAEQRAIVERWRSAHAQIAAASGRVEKKKAAIDANFLAALGLNAPAQTTQPKCFAVWWEDTEKWGVQQILQFKLRSKKETKFPEVLLSELCKIGSGGTPSRRNINYFGGSIPWVKTTEVVNAEIIKTEETLTDEGLENSSAKIFPKGSLLVAMYGQGATRGRTAKLGIDAATNQACAVLFDIKPQVETDFLWYFLMSQYDAMRALASGNNQPNLNAEMIANLQIALPPLEVQRKLVERVTAARAEIARERAAAAALRQTIAAEVEALILGTQPVKQA